MPGTGTLSHRCSDVHPYTKSGGYGQVPIACRPCAWGTLYRSSRLPMEQKEGSVESGVMDSATQTMALRRGNKHQVHPDLWTHCHGRQVRDRYPCSVQTLHYSWGCGGAQRRSRKDLLMGRGVVASLSSEGTVSYISLHYSQSWHRHADRPPKEKAGDAVGNHTGITFHSELWSLISGFKSSSFWFTFE
jgi:hypothetical protein